MSADNQQERLKTTGWVVGFIDGEGCFSVSLNKNPTTKLGWQVVPEFVVTQGEKSLQSLRDLQDFFKCGHLYVNRRYDNHRENVYRFCVRSLMDLRKKIIPFFQENLPRTEKKEDFRKLVQVVKIMEEGRHLEIEGLKVIATIATTMNRKKPSRFLASSETIR